MYEDLMRSLKARRFTPHLAKDADEARQLALSLIADRSVGIGGSRTVNVPAEARPVYKKTGIWPWFKHMVGVNLGYPYGDVNGDGEVNIADVNAVIKGILDGESAVLLDLSGDSEVNIADVNTVIKLILGD